MRSMVAVSLRLLGSDLSEHAHSAGEAARLQAWGSDAAVEAAVKAQNAKRVEAAQIHALHERWSARKAEDVVKQVLSGPRADRFRALRGAAHGETFATAKTFDSLKGDESKWQRAFHDGNGAAFIDRPKHDASSAQRLAQVSVPAVEKGTAIGVITIGVAVEKLKR